MKKQPGPDVIGLMPAAGAARRLSPLPCSKELFPTGFHAADGEGPALPRVVCQHLLEAMQRAGARKAYVVLRDGKWDIPAYLQDGHATGLSLAYLMMRLPFGVPYTLDQAYPFVKEALVIAGFPDILFHPREAFVHLLNRQRATGADIVLGLFPADRPHKADMVDIDAEGRVHAIAIKPAHTALHYAWIIAAWLPAFTGFMHAYARATLEERSKQFEAGQGELFLGEVIQAALEEGLHVEAVPFSEGRYLDIGTPDDLARAVHGSW